MPFVVVQSRGGPYEDKAFVAGVRYGMISSTLDRLAAGTTSIAWWVEPSLVPQLDMLAMDHHLKFATMPADEYPEAWVCVTFSRP
jgi:hypothetical protein